METVFEIQNELDDKKFLFFCNGFNDNKNVDREEVFKRFSDGNIITIRKLLGLSRKEFCRSFLDNSVNSMMVTNIEQNRIKLPKWYIELLIHKIYKNFMNYRPSIEYEKMYLFIYFIFFYDKYDKVIFECLSSKITTLNDFYDKIINVVKTSNDKLEFSYISEAYIKTYNKAIVENLIKHL